MLGSGEFFGYTLCTMPSSCMVIMVPRWFVFRYVSVAAPPRQVVPMQRDASTPIARSDRRCKKAHEEIQHKDFWGPQEPPPLVAPYLRWVQELQKVLLSRT